MILDKFTAGPDEPIRIDGIYSDQVRVELDGQPLRIDQIQADHIIVWTPLHVDYRAGRLDLVVIDGKVEEREPVQLTEYVPVEPVEAEPTSYLRLVPGEDATTIEYKRKAGSGGVLLTLESNEGDRREIAIRTNGRVGEGDLGKTIRAGIEQKLTLNTRDGLRISDKARTLDTTALKGSGWRVTGIREL